MKERKNRSEPAHRQWMDVVANDAVITPKEVCEWIDVSRQTLLKMIKRHDFPEPDFGGQKSFLADVARGFHGKPARKWRAGTVRAWVRGKWSYGGKNDGK